MRRGSLPAPYRGRTRSDTRDGQEAVLPLRRLGGLLDTQGPKLFLFGAAAVLALHSLVMAMFGWPRVPAGIPAGISIVHGVQRGIVGMLLLLVGSILLADGAPGSLARAMKRGAPFLYGAFVAHALFDYRYGGEPLDPALYSASAAMVVWFATFVFDRAARD